MKTLNPGKITFSFALGSSSLYAMVDRNADFQCLPVDHTIRQTSSCRTTAPLRSTTRPRSIYRARLLPNPTAIAISAERWPVAICSRRLCVERRQIVHLPVVTYEKRACARVELFSALPRQCRHGTRSDMMFVVTEYGMVNLKGKSVAESRQKR